MTISDVHILLLMYVMAAGPVNGYQTQRELSSWGWGDTATLRPGSVYNSLTTLYKRGYLRRYDLDDGGREVAVYLITDAGQAHLRQLVRSALVTPIAYDAKLFHAGVIAAQMFTRAEFIENLELRILSLELQSSDRAAKLQQHQHYMPPAARELVEMTVAQRRQEMQWCQATIVKARAGELMFFADGDRWVPPADDDIFRAAEADRGRYLKLIAEQFGDA